MRAHASTARLLLVLAVTAVAGCVVAGLALAQQSPVHVTADAKVIPDKAGTKRHPRGVKIDVHAHITVPGAYEPPLVTAVDVWFPKGGVYNGAKFPSCSQNTLARNGLKGCPKRSIMGHGKGKATADTVFTYPKITVVNGGGSHVYFYTVMNNPARVQAPVPGTITRLGGKWSYKLHATIPRVLQIVAGIPIVLKELHITAGRGDWIATTSCPRNHRWAYHVLVTFNTGETTDYDGTVPCRR